MIRVFNFDENSGKVSKKEYNDFIYTGIQIFHPRILKSNNLPTPPFSLSYFFNEAKLVKLRAMKLKGKFFHIGTVESLEKYQKLI